MSKDLSKKDKNNYKIVDIRSRRHLKTKEGDINMELTMNRSNTNIVRSRSFSRTFDFFKPAKSEWDELREWGSSLAKKKGLTKEDSRRILANVRNADGDNC